MTDFAKQTLESLPESERARLAESERFLRIKDMSDFVKSWENAQSVVGKLQADRFVEKPSKNATPEQWAEYYAAGGRPESPDGYEFTVPDGADADAINAMRPKFHEMGLSNKQVEEAVAFMVELGMGAKAQHEAQQVQLSAERKAKTLEKMKIDYGPNYETYVAFAQGEIKKAVGNESETAAELIEKYGNDPVVMRLAISLTKHNAPDRLKIGEASASGGDGNAEMLEKKIAAKRKELGKGFMSDPEVTQWRKQLADLNTR